MTVISDGYIGDDNGSVTPTTQCDIVTGANEANEGIRVEDTVHTDKLKNKLLNHAALLFYKRSLRASVCSCLIIFVELIIYFSIKIMINCKSFSAYY